MFDSSHFIDCISGGGNQKDEKEFEEDVRNEGLTTKGGGDFIESDERL